MQFICRATLRKNRRMRVVKRIVVALIVLVVLAIAALWATDNEHVLYGVRKTYFVGKKNPDIDDMAYFDVRKVAAGTYTALDLSEYYNRVELLPDEQAWSDSMGTTALLVFRRDSLLFEQYREGNEITLSNSFSMAKSITSILVGKANRFGRRLHSKH